MWWCLKVGGPNDRGTMWILYLMNHFRWGSPILRHQYHPTSSFAIVFALCFVCSASLCNFGEWSGNQSEEDLAWVTFEGLWSDFGPS